jgi:phenylalanyl-tRNA synthetase beta chain
MSWLRDLCGITDDVNTFCDKMTGSGNKVEGLTLPGHEITGVVVGRIISIEKHPNADKLLITKADIGEKVLQIVTGAQNLKVGDYIPVALDGSTLANGLRIKKSKMRGEESDGMLCSISELGYNEHDYPDAPEDGIYVLPGTPELGADIKPVMQLADEVVDFEVLSNRPDCNSIIGLAREAAATYDIPFSIPPITLNERAGGSAADYVSVKIENALACPRYIARIVKNVKIGPSPLWLRHRLTMSGLRPINNIVDITNYVMLEYGNPLHAFDIDNIAERDGLHKIIIRNARDGERFTTLDGAEHTLDESMLVIADSEKAVAIAGVMGGENSKVTGNANAILFESANFNGPSIRRTSRKLGMRTDASAKFEKNIDPNLAEAAVNRAMQLVELLGCGEVVPGMAEAYPSPRMPRTVKYNPERVNALIGINLSDDTIESLLNRVQIKAVNGEAQIPSYRPDITCDADIAEEAARLYGYDNVPARYTQTLESPGIKTPKQLREDRLRDTMLALGYSEAMTFPFEGPAALDKLLIPQDDPLRETVKILNPLSEEYGLMRNQTLNSLLEAMALNSKRAESARLFESAFVYRAKALPLTELPEERGVLTYMAYDGVGFDYFDIKGDTEALLAAMGIPGLSFAAATDLPFMHPGRAAYVSVAATRRTQAVPLGYVGEIHPRVRANYEIGSRVYAAVIDLKALHKAAKGYKPVFAPIAKYPAVNRDIALIVKAEVTAAEIEAAIAERGGPLLAEVKFFDVYQGAQTGEGYKSMAYSLRFRSPDRSLSDEDIQKPMRIILSHLHTKLGAELRDK